MTFDKNYEAITLHYLRPKMPNQVSTWAWAYLGDMGGMVSTSDEALLGTYVFRVFRYLEG